MEINENRYVYEVARIFIQEYITKEYGGNVVTNPIEDNYLKLHVAAFINNSKTEFEIDLRKIKHTIHLITSLMPLTTYLMGEIDGELEREEDIYKVI